MIEFSDKDGIIGVVRTVDDELSADATVQSLVDGWNGTATEFEQHYDGWSNGYLSARRVDDTALTAAADESHTGAMIALIPTAEDAERLAVDGGEEPDQLHVTLFYLGKAANFDQDARAQVVDRIHYRTRELPTLTVDAFAVSMFNPEGEEPCVTLQLSGEGLQEFHEAAHDAVAALDDDTEDVLPDQHPVWVPHITLAYTDDADLSYFTDRTGPVTFDRVRVAFGGDEFDIPLREETPSVPGVEDEYVDDETMIAGFDPSQPRDAIGRWTAEGSTASADWKDAISMSEAEWDKLSDEERGALYGAVYVAADDGEPRAAATLRKLRGWGVPEKSGRGDGSKGKDRKDKKDEPRKPTVEQKRADPNEAHARHSDGSTIAESRDGKSRIRYDRESDGYVHEDLDEKSGEWKAGRRASRAETYRELRDNPRWFLPLTPAQRRKLVDEQAEAAADAEKARKTVKKSSDANVLTFAVDADGDLVVPNVLIDLEALAREQDVNLPGGPGHQLRNYWVHGPGAAKIRWGTDGSFARCVRHLGKYVTRPQGLCAEYHKAATGEWPTEGGKHGIPSEGETETLATKANTGTSDSGELNTEARRQAADRGWAMPDGSYPIRDREHNGLRDLERAIRAVGRGGAPHDAIRRHIMKRARALGAEDRIPDNWRSSGTLEAAVEPMMKPMMKPMPDDKMSEGDCPPGHHMMPNGECMPDDEMNGDEAAPDGVDDYYSGSTTVPWEGVLVVEGEESGDGRMFAPHSLTWAELPLPLRWQKESSHGGDSDVTVWVGSVDRIWREPDPGGRDDVFLIKGAGTVDLGSEDGSEVYRRMRSKNEAGKSSMRFNSVDVDSVKDSNVELVYPDSDVSELIGGEDKTVQMPMFGQPELTIYHKGRIRGTTLVEIPAFTQAELALDDSAATPSARRMQALVAATSVIEVTDCPPREWFDEPTDVTPRGALTVTSQGRIYGYLAPGDVRHRSFANRATYAPRRKVDYDRFHGGETIVADGGRVTTGVITMDCGHASTASYVTADAAAEHYDNTCSLVATARVGENERGVWIAGALLPSVTAEQVRKIMACRLSGDWRAHLDRPGWREFVAALLVPVPGFPMARVAPSVDVEEGALVAASVPVRFTTEHEAADDGDAAFGASLRALRLRVLRSRVGAKCIPDKKKSAM